MKIKTITCHDVYNVGAGLQAYALLTYLEQLGHDVQIIDYKPDYLSKHYSFSIVGNPIYEKGKLIKFLYLMVKFPKRLWCYFGKRKRRFDLFKKEYLKVTPICYSSNEHLKDETPEADIYIAGSDQIWNPLFKNGRDPAFFLDFVPENKIKASYAASFAVESLPIELEKEILDRLKRLDFVSVREKSGLDIVKGLGVDRGRVVLDPVFLLDKTKWDGFCKETTEFNERYILIYDFDKNDIIEKCAKTIAWVKKYKIYSVFKCDYADKCFRTGGPIEFVSLVKNAEFVISNSFHATAFSLIFEKQFLVVKRKENINTRMNDLLEVLGLESRLINETSEFDNLIELDYVYIRELLKEKIDYSKSYIQDVLESEINER